ncbi:nucleotidyltransferase domain-containing protein [Phormidium yuhuli AB48]|uniref:Nucleotidyltransferase domain-containing protein n=1 Tax=Phormidium yuhuli AB48 TaxID=2940671 RepID=A0ABY5ASL2_9CYAN|nr:nucleotidyltransferase domain-containing protein [Phormidium yuhuli]USR92217.1 nucleotidyltransferase domain-containing protein [Phormidium yuhuli AB48]
MSQDVSIPQRDEVLATLRSFLRDRGETYRLEALGCFGSVARSQATAKSDVDVVYRPQPRAKLTLFDLALMHEELVARLGRPVDLIALHPSTPLRLKERIEQEVVYV